MGAAPPDDVVVTAAPPDNDTFAALPPGLVVVAVLASVTFAATFASIVANVRIAAAGELSIDGGGSGISDLGPSA